VISRMDAPPSGPLAGRIPVVSADLSEAQFSAISALTYRICGINLQSGKQGLVKTRLAKRLQAVGVGDFDEYLHYLEKDASGSEMVAMLDALTTNKTSFFRENQHFDYLRNVVLPSMGAGWTRLRIWSAGCSTGEEPYTLSLVLHEEVPELKQRDARILATDLSTRVLARARQGVYEAAAVADIPAPLLARYFTCVRTSPSRAYRVGPALQSPIRFARLNLMEPWPMQGPFDLIFCRNVMIYFDRATQQRLVNRFWELLSPGGHLFVGHSESLTALEHRFRYVQPAVYRK
jgi:chemotaxis protein methyltransferase CheR